MITSICEAGLRSWLGSIKYPSGEDIFIGSKSVSKHKWWLLSLSFKSAIDAGEITLFIPLAPITVILYKSLSLLLTSSPVGSLIPPVQVTRNTCFVLFGHVDLKF